MFITFSQSILPMSAKYGHILDYALRGLYRRRAKNLSLLIIYAAVTGFFASVILFSDALRREARNTLQFAPALTVQKLAGGRLVPQSLNFGDSLAAIRGVRAVQPRIWGYYFDSPTGSVFTLLAASGTVAGLSDLPDSGQVICGSGFLESHFLKTGDPLSLVSPQGGLETFSISGIFEPETALLSYDLLLLHPVDARRMLGLTEDEVTDFALDIPNPAETDAIGLKISRRFPGYRLISRAQILLTYEALFSRRGGLVIFGGLLSLLSFIVLAWDRASGLSREERRELGILKGVGWGSGDVLLLKFFEALAISVLSSLLGLLTAVIHVFYLGGTLLKSLLTGWSVLYPDYPLTYWPEPGSLLLIVTISVLPYLAATLIPAWQGAVTDPAEIMQAG